MTTAICKHIVRKFGVFRFQRLLHTLRLDAFGVFFALTAFCRQIPTNTNSICAAIPGWSRTTGFCLQERFWQVLGWEALSIYDYDMHVSMYSFMRYCI